MADLDGLNSMLLHGVIMNMPQRTEGGGVAFQVRNLHKGVSAVFDVEIKAGQLADLVATLDRGRPVRVVGPLASTAERPARTYIQADSVEVLAVEFGKEARI